MHREPEISFRWNYIFKKNFSTEYGGVDSLYVDCLDRQTFLNGTFEERISLGRCTLHAERQTFCWSYFRKSLDTHTVPSEKEYLFIHDHEIPLGKKYPHTLLL